MSDNQAGEKPKIIIDEDWKNRVEREREALQAGPGDKVAEATEAQPTAPTSSREPSSSPAQPLPPPSLTTLLSMLATQAMVLLGQIPSPVSNEREVHLEEAKHFIDLLDVVEEKTKGNLTREETKLLRGVLYDLRMTFVAVQKEQSAGAS